jgi:hypothetical protein
MRADARRMRECEADARMHTAAHCCMLFIVIYDYLFIIQCRTLTHTAAHGCTLPHTAAHCCMLLIVIYVLLFI